MPKFDIKTAIFVLLCSIVFGWSGTKTAYHKDSPWPCAVYDGHASGDAIAVCSVIDWLSWNEQTFDPSVPKPVYEVIGLDDETEDNNLDASLHETLFPFPHIHVDIRSSQR